MNFSHTNLKKLETLVKDAGYTLRYEKGHFNSGYCVLLDKSVVIINKYFTEDVKFQKLLDILVDLEIDERLITDPSSIKTLEKIKILKSKQEEIPFENVKE